MFRKETAITALVFFYAISAYAQSYNKIVEASLQVTQENNNISIQGIAINKAEANEGLSYKMSVFKTDSNNNKSKNEQNGQFNLSINEQKKLSKTAINYNKSTKIIILLLIFDSNKNILGKDRIVLNDNEKNNLETKKNIASKVEKSAIELEAQLINQEVEAKIHVDQQNDYATITGVALNRSSITQSLIYKLTVFNKGISLSNIEEEKSERFVLNTNQQKKTSSITFNLNKKDKKTVVLLIYDLDKKIIGKDKITFNNDSNITIEKKKEILEKLKKENSKDLNVEVKDGLELKGIVIEDTKTKPGRDFYQLFYSLYLRNKINGKKVVTIKEVLALGRNTKIEVEVENNTVFSFFVRPSIDYLTKMNDHAITLVYKYFRNLEKNSKIIKRY